MSGWLRVVGLGPGDPGWITPETAAILADASDLVGYAPYLARWPARPDQHVHGSDNRVELERAQHALHLTAAGHRVAVVSGGDPGIFAMASAVFEAIDGGDPAWRALDVGVAPGVSALQAAAARLGAPLGHDFCAINLSDNLKPWPVVAQRLRAAATADFVIALFNPASRARPDGIHQAFALLREVKEPETTVAFARAVGRPDEALVVTTLRAADPGIADMSTLVLVGSHATRTIARDGNAHDDMAHDGTAHDGLAPFVYTPRSVPTR
jgi:precorrin-3B C17-methyltransferase